MPIYCIASTGGDGSQTNTTHSAGTLDWSKADASIADLLAYDAAAFSTAGNTIYVASDHTQTQASALTIAGPASGAPVVIMSADRTNSTPTYAAATADQFITTGANAITFSNIMDTHGLRVKSGDAINLQGFGLVRNLYCQPASNRAVAGSASSSSRLTIRGLTIDCSADTAGDKTLAVLTGCAGAEISGVTVVSPLGNRTTGVSNVVFSHMQGCDFSALKSGATLFSQGATQAFNTVVASNIKTPASFVFHTITAECQWRVVGVNVGTGDAPESLRIGDFYGAQSSDTGVTRSGGGSVETVAHSWKIVTTANATEARPFRSGWLYGKIATTGSKTWTVYIAQDGGSADLTDAEAWLEVEYLGTSDSPLYSLGSDQRSTITTAAVAQTDDAASSWAGITATYKQSLAVTATVNETGLYRARVCVGKASATIYVDPKVTVT